MIETKKLQFAYHEKLNFLFPDIACQPGDELLITGASGTGKTTLLHLLAGLLPAGNGQVFIQKTDMSQLSGRALDQFRGKHIGVIFQQAHFVASLSVLENLILANWLAQGKKDVQKAMQLLDQLGIGNQADKKPAHLSIGQKQRAAIARALMNDPAILLADEPTSSLDNQNAAIVSDLLREQARQTQAALVVVTHDQRLKQHFHNTIELS